MPLIDWTLTDNTTGAKESFATPKWQSDEGNLLNLTFLGQFNAFKLNDKSFLTLWKYKAFLPVFNNQNIVSLGEGDTQIITKKFDDQTVFFKLEQLSPTGSFKDRGASVLVSKLKEWQITNVILDSSGNAGASIAAYSAAANIKITVIVPKNASAKKIRQMQLHGAKVIQHGNRAEAHALALSKVDSRFFYASHFYNPVFMHGVKTIAYEMAVQLSNNWPKQIFVPVGHGTLLLGLFTGLNELHQHKLIPFMPKLHAVQANNCATLKKNNNAQHSTTIAKGIAITNPPRLQQIKAAVNQTGGQVYYIKEKAIQTAHQRLAETGLFVENTSAVAFAAWMQAKNKANSMIPLTGSGLKDA